MPNTRNPVLIASAEATDVPALVSLEQASFSTDRLAARNFRQLLRRGNCTLLVARVRAHGVAVLAGYILVLYRRNAIAARIYSVAVDVRFRGQGLGERLLAAAEIAARQHGRQFIRLEVRPENRAAIALYERNGYSRFGFYAGFYEDGTDAHRFQKPLKSGSS